MKILNVIFEILGWLQIVASPLIAGIVIGGVVYLAKRDNAGLIMGISIAVIGLTVGIIWATRVWKKEGTINFMSKIIGTPELDEKKKGTDSN